MRKCLGASLVLLILSPASFGTTKYWVGADNNLWADTANWSLTSGGAGGVALPGAGDDVVFDSHSVAGNMPDMYPTSGTLTWAHVAPSVNSMTFNRPTGYGVKSTQGSRGIQWCPTINILTPDCYTLSDTLYQQTHYPGGVAVNTVAGSTLQLTGGSGLNGGGYTNYAGNPITLYGNGQILASSVLYGSLTVADCGTIDVSPGSGVGRVYNLTSPNQGNILFGGGSWAIYSRGTARGSNMPPVSIGNYALAKPVVFKAVAASGSYRTLGIFFNYSTYNGDNTTIAGLKAQFLKTDATHYSSPFGGDTPSSIYADDTSGHNVDFTGCRFSGNSVFWMTQTLKNIDSTGTGRAYTLKARATEFAPDCGTGITGIFRIVGNLQLFDNKDLAHTPCTLTIGVAGTAGVAGTDFSQLQVNKTDCTSIPGGVLLGLDNMILAVNLKSGLNPTALKNEQIVVLSSDTTDFSLLGLRFANDSGGVNGWHYGAYSGTVTYNALSGGTSTVVLSDLQQTPEPATLLLMISGALGALGYVRRQRMK